METVETVKTCLLFWVFTTINCGVNLSKNMDFLVQINLNRLNITISMNISFEQGHDMKLIKNLFQSILIPICFYPLMHLFASDYTLTAEYSLVEGPEIIPCITKYNDDNTFEEISFDELQGKGTIEQIGIKLSLKEEFLSGKRAKKTLF